MRSLKRVSLHVGINNYQGPNLSGCITDATNLRKIFSSVLGYETEILTNDLATKESIVDALEEKVSSLKWGDRLVFSYSGHGTQLPDKDGDEADSLDEALVLYDYKDGGFLTDDEMFEIFRSKPAGSRVTVISDCCFSGGGTRFFSADSKVKYLPAYEFLHGRELRDVLKAQRELQIVKPRPGPVVFTACQENEVSYDAYIDGGFQGAFTWALIKAWDYSVTPGLSYGAIQREIAKTLPSDKYAQTPQLFARIYQKYWRF